jgi:hypothetical protein
MKRNTLLLYTLLSIAFILNSANNTKLTTSNNSNLQKEEQIKISTKIFKILIQ